MCCEIYSDKNCIQKKTKFSTLLKVILLYSVNCKQFLLLLVHFCSKVIILILFLLNIFGPLFLIYLFHERFEIVQNTGYIKGSFRYVLGYHLFINQLLVSLCQASTDQTADKDSSLIFLQKNYIKGTLFLSRQFYSLVIIIFYWLLAIKKM